MVPERYRRLWMRRLRRRPLLPLLITAVLAVDAVLLAAEDSEGGLAAGFFAAQLGAIAIWTTHARRNLVARLLIATLALLGVFAMLVVGDRQNTDPALMLAFVMAISWVQMLASGLVHRAALFARRGDLYRRRPPRFTVSTLLIAASIVALLVTIWRLGDWVQLTNPRALWLVMADGLTVGIMLALFHSAKHGWKSVVLLGAMPLIILTFNSYLLRSGLLDESGVFYSMQALTLGSFLLITRMSSARSRQEKEQTPPIATTETMSPATLPMHLDVEA